MKRRIEFRGKRVSDGKWIYGYYFYKWRTSQHVIHLNEQQGICTDCEFEVIPETVGQLIGLKDRDGKEIFEGDAFGNDNMPVRYVIFEDGKFCFNIVHSKGADTLSQDRTGRLSIIGNIHDNPELITN